MNARRPITDFTSDVLRLSRLLQDGGRLTPIEEMLVKAALETLQQDLEHNQKDRPQSR